MYTQTINIAIYYDTIKYINTMFIYKISKKNNKSITNVTK